MKRFICFFLILILLIPTAIAQEAPFSFSISSAVGQVGDTVTVIGSVKNAPVCASYRVYFTYDTAVLKPVEGKNIGAGGLSTVNINASYQNTPAICALAADASKVLEGDMELFSVTFKIIGEPQNGVSPLTLRHYEFFDATPSPVTPDGMRVGAVYTEELTEVVLILRTLIGIDCGIAAANLDQDLNGTLSISDAVFLLQKLSL